MKLWLYLKRKRRIGVKPLKIVVAPDSFKGSLSAKEICNIVEKAGLEIFPESNIIKLPVADGGEGTVESLLDTLSGSWMTIPAKDPMGREIRGSYGIFSGDKAILEMALVSGLPLVSKEERNVMKASTFGTGQLILDAAKNGCNTIYLGIGGSATNDGGIGCLAALGIKFLDASGDLLEAIPENFMKIHEIDTSGLSKEVQGINLVIMCDVKNPLLGETGATYVYGPQKGANDEQKVDLEQGLAHLYQLIEAKIGREITNIPGTGAAGGLGAGLLAFTNACLKSGVDTILEILEFEKHLEQADLVVTGEGMMDYQSAYGKVAHGVGMMCKEHGIGCFAIVGGMGERAEEMYEHGIDSIMTTVNGIMDLNAAIQKAPELCYQAAIRGFRLIRMGTLFPM